MRGVRECVLWKHDLQNVKCVAPDVAHSCCWQLRFRVHVYVCMCVFRVSVVGASWSFELCNPTANPNLLADNSALLVVGCCMREGNGLTDLNHILSTKMC